MSLTNDDVKHIAKLARLDMAEEEIEKFTTQLSGILDNASMLDEVDVKDTEPIAQITGLTSVHFEDERKDCDYSDELLNESPQGTQDRMIKVKKVF